MKPLFLQRKQNQFSGSISMQRHEYPHFLNLWHYHEELELVYIVRSTGNCFIGDNIESFDPGTLVLLGANLPHRWLNDRIYFEEDAQLIAEALVIHFPATFLHTNLKHIPELHTAGRLIEQAQLGIRFTGKSCLKVPGLMREMPAQDDFQRLLTFLTILKRLSEEKECRTLSSPGYLRMIHKTNSRLGKVHDYVMNHFQQDISLKDIASIAHMNKSAFCRYFKQSTQKTFSLYLNEIRIGYACKLLMEREGKAISEIAYECGFNNVSNFNRQFKIITQLSPTAYLKAHLEEGGQGLQT